MYPGPWAFSIVWPLLLILLARRVRGGLPRSLVGAGFVGGGLLGAALWSCSLAPAPTARPSGSSLPVASANSPPEGTATTLPPLVDAAWLEHLDLPGFGPASVSVPLGATDKRPVVVALHARNDRPEWACGEWRGITNAYPFILCPHGTPIHAPSNAGLVYADAATTRREIDAGLRALQARFDAYMAPGPTVLAGFSLGAILGVKIVSMAPEVFPLAILGEGGQEQWTPDAIARFAKGGGHRVAFGCSTGACEIKSALVLPKLARAGIDAKLVSAGHIGHLVDDRVVNNLRPAFAWLTRDDPRYAGAPQAGDAGTH